MAFGANGSGAPFKTATKFVVGYGMVLDLVEELPRQYDEDLLGDGAEKGFLLVGVVVNVLGAPADSNAPNVGDEVTINVRPNDARQAIFDDLEKTKEGMRFLVEGVAGEPNNLVARWVHGAGENRSIRALEIVGAPHVSFENPVQDGPRNGWLYLNLDGSATEFDVRGSDGTYMKQQIAYDEVVSRLKTALDQNLKFRVGQRVLVPSEALVVNDQNELEVVLTAFRKDGFTSCMVRSFIPGTSDARQVDVQLLSWPQDIPANAEFVGATYEMPLLQETKRFVDLRDGEAVACMEVIPGYTMNLIGNKEVDKSSKHKFVRDIVKGLTDAQKNMYAAQNYGPGISVSAVSEDGAVSGITRLAIRTQGTQYRNLMTIPTPNFVDADKIKSVAASVTESGAEPLAA